MVRGDTIKSDQHVTKLIALARSCLGASYKYGASLKEAPKAFDCSGFVQYLFRNIGIELPRSTILQASHGTVVSRDNLRSGDLIFLRGERGFYTRDFPQGIGHVLLYVGDGKVLQARSTRTQDYPGDIVEEGRVVEDNFEDAIARSGPLVVIKRIIE